MQGASKPLAGTRVLITRSEDDASALRHLLEQGGASVTVLPTIERIPPDDWSEVDRTLEAFGQYDWCVFTSRHAVAAVGNRLRRLRVTPAGLPQFAVVGEATRKVLVAAFPGSTVVAGAENAEDLASVLAARGIRGKRILLPAADIARPVLAACLRESGALVDAITVYRTVAPRRPDPALIDRLRAGAVDVVVFASPSAVRNLVAMLEGETSGLSTAKLVCIGDTTASAVIGAGLGVAAVAHSPSTGDLAAAVESIVRGEENEKQRHHGGSPHGVRKS